MKTFLSVCSGIEAASVAWHALGWRALAYSEIEAFPSAVLAHHYPETPNLGDMTTYESWPCIEPDVLVGGTPCQSFSVAGLRAGLDDPRGQLMLVYGAIARQFRPRWLVWENVPGVLSSGAGRDFASLLGLLSGQRVRAPIGGWRNSGWLPGYRNAYGLAWRTLDAQFFGVPQRRRRVFVVGCLGDFRRAAAVLFERHSLSGHPAPRREAGKAASALTANGIGVRGVDDNQAQAGHLIPMVSGALVARAGKNGSAGEKPDKLIPATLAIRGRGESHDLEFRYDGTANTLLTPNGGRGGIGVGAFALPNAVRRFTPRECERLQGFPDDYTAIPYRGKPAADGPRYKALGNSMAVPVMRWIGERIEFVEQALQEAA